MVDGKYQRAPQRTLMIGFLTDLVSYTRMVVNPRPLARTVHAERTMLRIPPVLRADRYYPYLQSKLTL